MILKKIISGTLMLCFSLKIFSCHNDENKNDTNKNDENTQTNSSRNNNNYDEEENNFYEQNEEESNKEQKLNNLFFEREVNNALFVFGKQVNNSFLKEKNSFNVEKTYIKAGEIGSLENYYFTNNFFLDEEGKTKLENITENNFKLSVKEAISLKNKNYITALESINCSINSCSNENKIFSFAEWDVIVDKFEDVNKKIDEQNLWSIVGSNIKIKAYYYLETILKSYEFELENRPVFVFDDISQQMKRICNPLSFSKNDDDEYFYSITDEEEENNLGRVNTSENFEKKLKEFITDNFLTDKTNRENYFFQKNYNLSDKEFYNFLLKKKYFSWDEKFFDAEELINEEEEEENEVEEIVFNDELLFKDKEKKNITLKKTLVTTIKFTLPFETENKEKKNIWGWFFPKKSNKVEKDFFLHLLIDNVVYSKQ